MGNRGSFHCSLSHPAPAQALGSRAARCHPLCLPPPPRPRPVCVCGGKGSVKTSREATCERQWRGQRMAATGQGKGSERSTKGGEKGCSCNGKAVKSQEKAVRRSEKGSDLHVQELLRRGGLLQLVRSPAAAARPALRRTSRRRLQGTALARKEAFKSPKGSAHLRRTTK